MAALQRYVDAEIRRRHWSMDQFAERAQLSLSNAYLIVRDGKDNVRQKTFDNIAEAFGMTPAELAIVIGKGTPALDPAEAMLIALFRLVPEDRRAAAADMLRGLAAESKQAPKRRAARLAMEPAREAAAVMSETEDGCVQTDNGALAVYRMIVRRLSGRVMLPLAA